MPEEEYFDFFDDEEEDYEHNIRYYDKHSEAPSGYEDRKMFLKTS